VETISTLASLAGMAINKARLIAQLKDANEQLAELDRLKSNFIAVASHELRTPLAIMMGYITLLKEEVGGRELDRVLQAAVRLRGLMDEMFNLRYIDAGTPQLSFSRFCVARLAREAISERHSLAEAKEQTVESPQPDDSAIVVADKESVRLVLSNLLSNAVSFTPVGGKISATITKRPAEVWVSVQDNGVGIPQAEQARIFDRFYQVEHHMTRRHGGLGLGLSLAKELLDLQNGRIWLESEEGKGSTFTFALPLADLPGA
jgi:signal transduction histidine kinase